MRYSEIPPSPVLRRYVQCYWTLEAASEASAPAEPVMPDGRIELIFNLADPFRRFHADGYVETQPLSIVAGQMRSCAMIGPSGAIDLFGVRFRHAGAAPFFSFPLNELTDRIIDLKTVLGARGRQTEERLNEARTLEHRVEIIESALLRLLSQNTGIDVVVENASRMIVENMGLAAIDRVTGALGVKERTLERRFQQKFGLSPKRFSRIIRFQNFLNAARTEHSCSILDTALSFGYYDQAHLIREFREFSWKTPLAFFGREHKLSEIFINAG
jgi:AraC-like DNA-binding protein